MVFETRDKIRLSKNLTRKKIIFHSIKEQSTELTNAYPRRSQAKRADSLLNYTSKESNKVTRKLLLERATLAFARACTHNLSAISLGAPNCNERGL